MFNPPWQVFLIMITMATLICILPLMKLQMDTIPLSLPKHNESTSTGPNRGKLFRNDMDPVLKHGVFHDVSDEAGITYNGYGHAATVCDINNDGWKDIYVSDDFLSNNILYINNHDGTFSNRLKEYFKHTSFNSMGQDVADSNTMSRR